MARFKDNKDKLYAAIVLLGLLNFFVFFCTAMYLGGDAINGHSSNGHYYLADHGHLTEVSRAVFAYSKWHVISVWITHPLAIVCGILLMRRHPELREQVKLWRSSQWKR